MDIKDKIDKIACILFACSLGWMVFWFGGVHPSEAWIGFMCLLICGLILSYEFASKNIYLNCGLIDVTVFALMLLWSILAIKLSTIRYYSIKNTAGYFLAFSVLLLVKKNHGIRNNAKNLTIFALVCGVLVSIYAAYQRLTISNSVLGAVRPEMYSGRYGAVFINPNHLASFLICLHPVILVALVKNNIKKTIRILFAILYILIGLAIYSTMSRGGWIGLLIGSLVVLSVRYVRSYRIVTISAVLTAVFAGFVIFSCSNQFRSRINSIAIADSPDSGMFRIWLWKSAFQMWSDNKLIGVGPGQFQARFPQYRPPTIPVNPEYVHNEYLEILVEYGVLGFAALILVLYRIIFIPVLVNIKSLIKNNKLLISNEGCLILGCIGGICSLMVHAMFEFCFHIPAVAILGALIIGVNWNAPDVNAKVKRASLCVLNNYVLSAAILLLTVFLMRINLQAAREDMFLRKASMAGITAADRIDFLTRANRVQPNNPQTLYWIGEELRLLATNSISSKDPGLTDAINYFKRSAEIDPHFPGNFMSIGLCAKEMGDSESALYNLKKSNRLGINDVRILNCLTRLLIDNGDLNGAKNLNNKSLSINWWNNIEAIYFKNLINQKN